MNEAAGFAHGVARLVADAWMLFPTEAQYREGLLIKSPTAYEKVGKQEAQQHPVGTGPFKLAKWEQNNLIVLEKNKEYWKPGLPHLDRIEFKIMKDGVTRATALRAGEVDYVSWLPREHVDRVAKALETYDSVGEHGDYPLNERQQHLYPRRRFFAETAAVFIQGAPWAAGASGPPLFCSTGC